ncbi:MAG: YbjN domain-containing protein [Propionicimonas sp.]|uniref:YbjN domain-containing protein n=1 Tax=Propionicimonas sp. TaxID=1955623 RepID=UPI002B20CF23|nr:YbjN domain-containing protein [Propionicimonas sp.]MEA4944954.1 YbjN domain-containing protein [Propionicimonas sp.]MEA5053957.1 YbjN domain-containing protein [Propionicimonas sp.]MEA5119255.1 YbjN domain-containing protein [Propionicimonas sp.]
MAESEPGRRGGLEPLSKERVAAALDARGSHYLEDEDGDLYGFWDGCLFYFFVMGRYNEILQVRGTWWGRLSDDQYDAALRATNDWNLQKIWPKAYARVDDGEVRIVAEVSVDYEHDLTDAQLGQHLNCALGTTGNFFDQLNETFAVEAAIARAEFERD